jgi:hypothetical protein
VRPAHGLFTAFGYDHDLVDEALYQNVVPGGPACWRRAMCAARAAGDNRRPVENFTPAARACVALVGASDAHIERHGMSRTWKPDLFWLANCPSKSLAHISLHLLDRFPLRIGVMRMPVDEQALFECLSGERENEDGVPAQYRGR